MNPGKVTEKNGILNVIKLILEALAPTSSLYFLIEVSAFLGTRFTDLQIYV